MASGLLATRIDGPAGNLNKVFGMDDSTPQTSMWRPFWIAVLIAGWSVIYTVSHLLCSRVVCRTHKGARLAQQA